MLEKWYNFKDTKPTFKQEKNDVRYSDPILFMINGSLRFGYYTNQAFMNEKGKEERDDIIELATLSLSCIQDDYRHPECLGINEFDNFEIYWSPISLIDIILSIDLLKQEKESEHVTKTQSDTN